eukprot:2284130-Prymnesium_polylepis.2
MVIEVLTSPDGVPSSDEDPRSKTSYGYGRVRLDTDSLSVRICLGAGSRTVRSGSGNPGTGYRTVPGE